PESSASRRTTEQETSHTHIRGGPDEICNALEAEHRVVNEKRNGVDPVRSISRARGDARGHGARLGDALFENLSVLRFLVVEQRIYIDGLVTLADAGINADGAEKRFHAESASFVRNDRHDEFADLRILKHLSKHAHERHRR